MKNKFVDKVNPYKPSERDRFKNIELFLDWNESDLSWGELDKVIKYKNLSIYPSLDNSLQKKKILEYIDASCHIDLFPGSDISHEYILRAFGRHNSSLLMLNPGYSNFMVTAQSLGIEVKNLYLTKKEISNFEILFKKLFILKNPPDMFYLINPHSPTGNFLSKKNIEILLKKFEKSFFIIDEAYVDFNLSLSVASLIKDHSNLIITRSFSKAFSLAGSRIGYSLTNKINSDHLKKIVNTKHLTDISRNLIIHTMNNRPKLERHVMKINKNILKIHEIFKERNLSKLNSFNTNFYFILFATQAHRNRLFKPFY